MHELRYIGLVPLLFFVIGTALAYAGIRQRLGLRRFSGGRGGRLGSSPRCTRAVGSRYDYRSLLHFPVVRFTLPDGHEVETEVMSGSNPAPAHTGETVTVLYDPRQPTRARIDGFWADGTLVVGALVSAAGCSRRWAWPASSASLRWADWADAARKRPASSAPYGRRRCPGSSSD